ncbi:FliI/YscN family ATPase [Pontivivens ytuae]|uniref:Flagellum-specific ATP synthase FliI n=1 Tax=Pontivivens ytuae TaxID=2789856 RepID=A0A7S9LPY6_9RHOB|nr:flagellum-specific ATP synthase FliI [Pontivivens ytuae]QPH53083.1 flagellum-specific ATP synthase FliI [Pontivivens ytuae]
MPISLADLTDQVRDTPRLVQFGRVLTVAAERITALGLDRTVELGTLVGWEGGRGEVVALEDGAAIISPHGNVAGLRPGMPLRPLPDPGRAPHDGWLGRVVDAFGQPLDGAPLAPGVPREDQGAPHPLSRRALGFRLDTGVPALDTMLPLVRGQRMGLFAGSGVGKSRLLLDLARNVQADVVIFALLGERGRDLKIMLDEGLAPVRDRSVAVVASSDRPALERRRALETALRAAEHFRDRGAHVLLLVDSLTRFAEAHREVALASGEAASLRGHPPSTPHRLASLVERMGPGIGSAGDITAVMTALVAGSDMEEPVADMVRGLLDGHIVLDRDIAERGRFPAIDVETSVSRALPDAATPEENILIREVRHLMARAAEVEPLRRAGLYEAGTDPERDRAVALSPVLDTFFGRRDLKSAESSFQALAAIVAKRS